MRYLAQVQKQEEMGEITLRLLAVQKSEYTWTLISEKDMVVTPKADQRYGHGAFVLLDLSDTQEVLDLQSATEWLLTVVDQYLTSGLSPIELKQEVERAEQWRQSLTLRSQELGRQALEMEARRDQIHELETNLKEERRQLEAITSQIKADAESKERKVEALHTDD